MARKGRRRQLGEGRRLSLEMEWLESAESCHSLRDDPNVNAEIDRYEVARVRDSVCNAKCGGGFAVDFSALMRSHSSTLAARLSAARAALEHAGQKGTAAETALIEMLSDTLPKRIGLTEGIVVSSAGYVSPQQDIIVYDAEASPIFFQAGSTKAIPIEFVYAVIEVKSSLTAADVKAFSRRNYELRSQQKFFVGDTEPKSSRLDGYTYHQAGRKWFSPPVNAFLFAYECSSLESVWEAFKECHSSTAAYANWIDAICIVQDAYFARHTNNNGLGDTVAQPTSLVWVREMPFLAFLGQFWLHSVEWRILERPAMFRYIKNYSFGIARAEPFQGRITHADCMPEDAG